jgi:hydrogenase maturation protease
MSFDVTDGRAPTLVLGLGNPILGDDGVGWRVSEALVRRLESQPALAAACGPLEIDRTAVGGLSLMERLVGYRRAVLVDAIEDGELPGSVWSARLADAGARAASHLDSIHDTTLKRALELGDELGAALPSQIHVVTVSVAEVGDFSETLEPRVAAAVERAVDAVINILAANLVGGR